jgi:hypothetical protein
MLPKEECCLHKLLIESDLQAGELGFEPRKLDPTNASFVLSSGFLEEGQHITGILWTRSVKDRQERPNRGEVGQGCHVHSGGILWPTADKTTAGEADPVSLIRKSTYGWYAVGMQGCDVNFVDLT